WLPNDPSLLYRFMLDQFAFDFKRTDPLPRGIDHVIIPALEEHIVLVVLICQVPGQIPSFILEIRIEFVLIAPYLLHQSRPRCPDRQLACRTSWNNIPCFIQYADFNSRKRSAHRTRFDFFSGEIDDKMCTGLRHPPCIVDSDAQFFPCPVDHFRIERLTDTQYMSE